MKNLLIVLTIVLFVFIKSYSYDYTFACTDYFVNTFVNNYKDELKDAGIEDFHLIFLENKIGKINMKHFVSLEIEFSVETVSKNHIRFYIHKFEALGFISVSKEKLIKKITEAFNKIPEIEKYLNLEISSRKNKDEFYFDMNIRKNPLPVIPGFSIKKAFIKKSFFTICGNI